MPDLESKLRAYAVRLDERYPDVTVDELTASPHAERLDGLAGPIDLVSVVSATRARTVKLSEAEPTNGTSNRRRLLIVAAAVVVVIGLLGIALATTNHNDQSPAPAGTVTVAPTTTVATDTVSVVVRSANDIPVTFTKPKGWGVLDGDMVTAFSTSDTTRPTGTEDPRTVAPATTASQTDSAAAVATSSPTPTVPPEPTVPRETFRQGAMVSFDSVYNIYPHGCAWISSSGGSGVLDPPVGPTVDDLVTAWANVPELVASAPVDITVDGYTGKQIEFSLPPIEMSVPGANGCAMGTFGVWTLDRHRHPGAMDGCPCPRNVGSLPGEHFKMLVLDVDGTRLLIAASTYPDTPPQDRAGLEELLASIQIG